MKLFASHTGIFPSQLSLNLEINDSLMWRRLGGLLLVFLCCSFIWLTPSSMYAAPSRLSAPLVTHEIRYRMADAGEVFFVWGLDGWTIAPEASRPAGTQVRDKVMYTPMARDGDIFAVQVQASQGAMIDYVFQITRTRSGAAIEVWDANGNPKQDYHTVAAQNGLTEVNGTVSLLAGDASIATISLGPRWRGLLLLLLGVGLVFGIRATSARFRNLPSVRFLEFAKTNIAKLVIFILLTRVMLLLIGYVSVASYSNPNENYIGFNSAYAKKELQSFGRADVWWYMDIARNGYEHRPFSLEKHANWAFYPLWPMILRLCNLMFSDMVVSGMFISTIFFVLSEVFLYKLILLDFDENIAMSTAVLVAIFPAAYFCLRPGPEAIFLFLTIASIFYARKSNWILAGSLGALATLSRLQGLLLFLPLLYIYYKEYRLSMKHNARVLSLMAMPIALGSFMYYMYFLTGNFFASFDIQKIWDNNASYPFDSMIGFLSNPQIVNYYGFDLSIVSFIFVFSAVILTIVAIGDRRVPREYVTYVILNMFLVVARDTLTGSLRYIIAIFPLFLILSLLLHNRKMTYNLIFFTLISVQLLYFTSFVQQYNWAAN